MENKPFQFDFSLEILNHLGRGLYRSFATVIAEAISNSWDAEALSVQVTLNEKGLIVEDTGKGMDDFDFQNKFLKVGYSRRLDPSNKPKRRVIGRKGIGKLAMLSISDKVTVISKKKGGSVTGGKIDNAELDKKIANAGHYSLEALSAAEKASFKKSSGTRIVFEGIRSNLNSESVIRRYLATQFNFIFSMKKNDRFRIVVNGKSINKKDLQELDDNTEFIWYLGKKDRERAKRYKNLKKSKVIDPPKFNFGGKEADIKGFIAAVRNPKNLILRGSGGDFKASVNLFANGRLRQENLFQEITSKRIPEEYVYGEIHVDGFEDEEIDRFTSSREGIIKDDPFYQAFLKALKKIQSIFLDDWTPWRNEQKEEGDIEDERVPKYKRRLEDSQNWREMDFAEKIKESISDPATKKSLKEKLRNLSYKNTLIYQDLFILENILREYIKIKNITENNFDQTNEDEKTVLDIIKNIRGLRKKGEERHALKGKIVKNESYLNYADLWCLAEIIDLFAKKGQRTPVPKKYKKDLSTDAKEIEPVRNPIMHTNEVTEDVIKWDKIKNVIDYIEKLKDK